MINKDIIELMEKNWNINNNKVHNYNRKGDIVDSYYESDSVTALKAYIIEDIEKLQKDDQIDMFDKDKIEKILNKRFGF